MQELAVLGRASKVIATKEKTRSLSAVRARRRTSTKRVAGLRKQASAIDSKYDREQLEKRVAKLSGGVAVIRVGAATETEMKYLKLKIEDAVNATKAAIEEGIVAGGGSALVKAAEKAHAVLVALEKKQADLAKDSSKDSALVHKVGAGMTGEF